MKLVLSYADTPLWADFLASWPGLPQLSELPATLSAHAILSPVVTSDQLTAMLQNSDISQLVVFFSQAEYSIAEQLQQGCSMEAACEHWVKQMTQLSALQRKNRQKVKLINLHQALQHPVALQEQLQLLGLAAPACDATRLPTTLELLLSCQTVRQHDSMQQLNTLFQASALPLAETEQLTLDLPQFQQQQDRISKAKQQESDLLLHQLQHVQEELEQLFQKKLDVKQKYQDLKADYDRELSELSGNLRLREETVQASQQQLTKLQQQLDRVTTEHNALQHQAAELADVKQENDLLLQQLMNVQEELERYYLQGKQQQSNMAELKVQLQKEKTELLSVTKQKNELQQIIQEQTRRHTLDVKTLQQKERELKKLQQEHKQLQAEYAGQRHQLYQVDQEVKALKNSRLWKTSAPLRKLGQLVQRRSDTKQQLQRDIGLLFTSEYFDADWYLKMYPDVAEAGMNPAEHYLQYGAAEGRFPSLQFDGNWYLQRYADVAKAGLNPLVHFIKFGQAEGRQISPKLLANQTKNKAGTPA